MKKFYQFAFVLLAFAVSSCLPDPYDNVGYVGAVSFPAEGGEVTLNGEEAAWGFSIESLDFDKGYAYGDLLPGHDSIIVSYDWLTVKTKFPSNKITLIAKPMEQEGSRAYGVTFSLGDRTGEIKVRQQGVLSAK